jgi:uncharacterized membrane protein YedE/YeeE
MNAVLGGALIGLAVSLLLLFNGKVTGVSGIAGGAIEAGRGDRTWRLLFLAGLVAGGTLLRIFAPDVFAVATRTRIGDYVAAGLLVGFGTLLGNGCTSGHGVCGISRLSPRSLLATATFIAFGVLSAAAFKGLRGGI